GVIHHAPLKPAAKEHRLQNKITLKQHIPLHLLTYAVGGRIGPVDTACCLVEGRIKFQDGVVHFFHCIEHLFFVEMQSIGEYADFGVGKKTVPQLQGVDNESLKLRVHRRFSNTCKGNHIKLSTLILQ